LERYFIYEKVGSPDPDTRGRIDEINGTVSPDVTIPYIDIERYHFAHFFSQPF
jgi:hypothetical protein